MRFAIFISTFIYFNIVHCVRGENIADEISNNPDLSKFNEVLSSVNWLKSSLSSEKSVVFAPTNKAFEKFQELNPDVELAGKIAQEHIVRIHMDASYFNIKTPTASIYSSPLWFTKKKSDANSDEYEYFVNNAKILNFDTAKSIMVGNNKQTLYIIDEVLGSKYMMASAENIFKSQDALGLGKSISAFAEKLDKVDKKSIFQRGNRNTFFIPIGEIGKQNFNEVDEVVIRGHVIPDQVLFTRTMGDEVYKSDMYDKNFGVQVELSLANISNALDDGYQLRIKSNTMKMKMDNSESSLPRKGVVLSDIVMEAANIPVTNGVVHLIKHPLMVITQNMWEILEREKDGRLSEFMKFVDQAGLKNEFDDTTKKTLFAPSNEAFNMIPEQKRNELIYTDEVTRKKLIYLHMIQNPITSYDVLSNLQNANILSMDKNRPLYFNVHGSEGNRTLTVEGGGVNATAIESDIGATNGIVHIINHILGVPFRSISDKLKSDAKLSITYKFGEGSKWTDVFKNNNRNFTLFVPDNEAWRLFERDHPTTFKQLDLNGVFSEKIPMILNRHIILDQVLTRDDMTKLQKIKTKSAELSVGSFKYANHNSIEKFDDSLDLHWEKKKATIIRPDVKATNGIIHVINAVFMERDDITSGSDSSASVSIVATLISALIFKLLA